MTEHRRSHSEDLTLIFFGYGVLIFCPALCIMRATLSDKEIFERQFIKHASERCEISPRARMLVALSGGADSVALLYLLKKFSPQFKWKIFAAHFNHKTRGKESDRDEAFVRALCEKQKIPLFVARRKGRTDAKLNEEKLRSMRFEFLHRAAERAKAKFIAFGHQKNDAAETLLLFLIRGAGAEGLTSLSARTIRDGKIIVRPLLPFSRGEISEYLKIQKIAFRKDSSNRSLKHQRNRIRRKLIPLMEKEFNPRIVDELAKTAEILREENALLDRWAKPALTPRGLSVKYLKNMSLALRRRAARLATAKFKGDLRRINFNHIESVLRLLDAGRETHLPDWLTVVKRGKFLYFKPSDKKRKTSQTPKR